MVHRGAHRVRHRAVPDRAVPADAEAAHRRGGGVARRRAQHHFRHLGLVRAGARAAAARAALADRASRARYRASAGCSRGLPTASAFSPPDWCSPSWCCRSSRRPCAMCSIPFRHAQGIGLRAGRNHLGSHLERGGAALAGRHHGRRDAGARTRPRRDHGGHLRHRQRASHLLIAAGAGHDHLLGHCQRIHRSGGRPLHLLAHRARAIAVPHHFLGHCRGAGDAAAARTRALARLSV